MYGWPARSLRSEKTMDGQPEALGMRNVWMASQKPEVRVIYGRPTRSLMSEPEAWGKRNVWMVTCQESGAREMYREQIRSLMTKKTISGQLYG